MPIRLVLALGGLPSRGPAVLPRFPQTSPVRTTPAPPVAASPAGRRAPARPPSSRSSRCGSATARACTPPRISAGAGAAGRRRWRGSVPKAGQDRLPLGLRRLGAVSFRLALVQSDKVCNGCHDRHSRCQSPKTAHTGTIMVQVRSVAPKKRTPLSSRRSSPRWLAKKPARALPPPRVLIAQLAPFRYPSSVFTFDSAG